MKKEFEIINLDIMKREFEITDLGLEVDQSVIGIFVSQKHDRYQRSNLL